MAYPSSEGSGWNPRSLTEAIREQKPSIIPHEVLTLHDVPTANNPPIDREAFQYPVVSVNENSRLHFVPVDTGLYILLTEPSTARVKSQTRPDCDFFLSYEGRHEVAEMLTQGLHNEFKSDKNLQSDLLTTLQEAECLGDPFDEMITSQFRPPVVRWILRRTIDVQYSGKSDLNNPSANASWNITLEVSEGSNRKRTITIPHQKFLSGQSSVFTSRYKRTFPHQNLIRLSDEWWFDLSQFFIERANYEGTDLLAVTDEIPPPVEYRQSGAGKFHLTDVNGTDAVCGCSVRSSNTRPFDPRDVPFPAAICVNCVPEIKRHLIATQCEN